MVPLATIPGEQGRAGDYGGEGAPGMIISIWGR